MMGNVGLWERRLVTAFRDVFQPRMWFNDYSSFEKPIKLLKEGEMTIFSKRLNTKMSTTLGLSVVVTSFMLMSQASANIIESTFDTGSEGWTPFQNAGATIQFNPSGGNPSGYISVNDNTNEWAYLRAPSEFRVPALYGGALSLDLQIFNDDPDNFPNIYNVRAALIGDGMYLINELSPPTTSWSNYDFLLNETAGWRIFPDINRNYSNTEPTPTQVQMQGVLSNLTDIFIATDYSDGVFPTIDQTSIDNVRLDAVDMPEPSTFFIIAVGFVALGFAGLRTRSA